MKLKLWPDHNAPWMSILDINQDYYNSLSTEEQERLAVTLEAAKPTKLFLVLMSYNLSQFITEQWGDKIFAPIYYSAEKARKEWPDATIIEVYDADWGSQPK